MSVKQFCEEQGLTEQSFYAWRKRLRETAADAIRIGGNGSGPARNRAQEASLELVLTTGERLRIGAGVDAATLAHVLEASAGMIHLPASVRVYLCLTACDMRKSFDGLHALVREHLELGCLRRASVRVRQPAARSRQDPVLGPRRIRDVEQAPGGRHVRDAVRRRAPRSVGERSRRRNWARC